MADEATLRLVIVEGGKADSPSPADDPYPPSDTPPDVSGARYALAHVVNSARELQTTITVLATTVATASRAIAQQAPKALAYSAPAAKALTYSPPVRAAAQVTATPYERMQDLAKRNASSPQLQEFRDILNDKQSSPEDVEYAHQGVAGVQKLYQQELASIFADAKMTPQEVKLSDLALIQGQTYEEIQDTLDVSHSRVGQVANSVTKKLGLPTGLGAILKAREAENRERADKDQTAAGEHIDFAEAEAAPNRAFKKASLDDKMSKHLKKWAKATEKGDALGASYAEAKIAELERQKAKHLASGGNIGYDVYVPGQDEATEVNSHGVKPFGASFEHHAEGGPVDDSMPFTLAEGATLYHASHANFDVLKDRPTWFSATEANHKGIMDRIADQGNEAHSYTTKLLGARLAQESEINDIAQQMFGDDFMYEMVDPNIGAYSKKEVSAFIDAVKARGFDGIIHADYGGRDGQSDVYNPVIFSPAKHTGPLEHHADGGRVDMSRGGGVQAAPGVPSGQDWHPAWLTDQEFVVNQRSAQKNRAALDAANSNPDVSLRAEHHAAGGWLPFGARVGVAAAADLAYRMSPAGPAMPTTAAGAAGMAADIAGGPIGMAVVMGAHLIADAQQKFHDAAVGAARDVGEFAATLANPAANPSALFSGAGDAITAGGEKVSKALNAANPLSLLGIDLFPQVKLLSGVVGETAKQFGVLMDAVKGTADRYGEYSPAVSQAQALVDVQHTMGELRRAQEGGPELARYLRAQGDLQQRVEDIKIKLLTKLLPLVTTVVNAVEGAMATGEGVVEVIAALATPLTAIAAAAQQLLGVQQDANRAEVADPTDLIFQQAGLLQGQGVGVPRE